MSIFTDGKTHGSIPDAVATLRATLTSAAFAEFLSDVTGLTFESVSSEVRCFAHGDYTMLCDPQYKSSLRKKKANRLKDAASAAAGECMFPTHSIVAAHGCIPDIAMCNCTVVAYECEHLRTSAYRAVPLEVLDPWKPMLCVL